MAAPSNILKRRLKYGPKMGREMRTEYLRFLVDAGPRQLSPGSAVKLRSELARLEKSGSRAVQKFTASMRARYPGVLG